MEAVETGLAQRLATLMAADATMWVWLTEVSLADAMRLVTDLGCTDRGVVAWIKHKAKGITDADFCVIATRGRPVVNIAKKVFETKVREGSGFRRPVEFSHFLHRISPVRDVLQCFGQPPDSMGWAHLADLKETAA